MNDLLLPFLFALGFGVFAWVRIRWAVTATLFFLPLYQLRFDIGPLPSTYLEVMIAALVLAWFTQLTSRKEWGKVQWPWRWLTLGFVLAGTVAVITSPETRAALGLFKAYIVEPVLFFYVFVNVMKEGRHLRLALWALGGSVVIIGFTALLQYIGLLPAVEPYASELPMRATSLFAFPTAVGKLVGPIVALFIAYVLLRRRTESRSERWFFIGVVAFGLIALMLSVSRGAVAGIIAATVFISFFSVWKKWIWACIFGLILLAVALPPVRSEIASVVTGSDASTDVHVVMWKGTVRLIQDRPIFGAGLAGFPIVYAEYKEASHVEFFPNPDHLILTVWAEMGLAGLIVFTWIVVKYFKVGIRLVRTGDSEQRMLVVGLLAAMVAVIVHGFVDTPYFKNDLAIVFWTMVGIMVVTKRAGEEKAEGVKQQR